MNERLLVLVNWVIELGCYVVVRRMAVVRQGGF
jgi:hypothetical protein